MRKNSIFRRSIILALFAASWTAFGTSNDLLTKSYLIFGLNEYAYNYSEKLGEVAAPHIGTPKSDEYGATSLFHIEGRWYPEQSNFFAGLLFEYGGGKHTYDGSTQDTFIPNGRDSIEVFAPITDSKSNTFTKVAIYAGPHFGTKDRMFALRGGLMYYRWYRGGLGSSSETYNWYYLPLGAEMSFKASDRLSIGCAAEYRLMLSGSMQVEFIDPSSSAPAVDLGTEHGFAAELPIRYQIDRNLGFEFKPWFELRPSGLSNLAIMNARGKYTPFYEPESDSYSAGVVCSIMLRHL